jgi:hypothetical protein
MILFFPRGSPNVDFSLILQVSKSSSLNFGTSFQIQEPSNPIPNVG